MSAGRRSAGPLPVADGTGAGLSLPGRDLPRCSMFNTSCHLVTFSTQDDVKLFQALKPITIVYMGAWSATLPDDLFLTGLFKVAVGPHQR